MTPKIVVSPRMGVGQAPGIETVETDLLLLTKVAGMNLGPGPQAIDQALDGLISRKIQAMRFKAELGQYLLFDLDPREYGELPQRYVLLAGLGSPSKFNGRAACQIFELFLNQALELKVERATIPFAPNRVTGGSLNLKGTAHILRDVLEDKRTRVGRSFGLRELELLCTPQAQKFIEEGLRIPPRHKRCCAEEQ